MSGRMEFEAQFSQPQRQRESQRSDQDPFRILVLGDFSARAHRGILQFGEGLAERPVLPVDVDNLESRLDAYRPELHLPLGASADSSLDVSFRQLDDFHPDRVYERLEVFRKLRELRRQLQNPATFREAASRLQREAAREETLAPDRQDAPGRTGSPDQLGDNPPPGAVESPAAAAEESTAMFERLLGKSPAEQPQVRVGGMQVDLERLIQNIMQPYITADADPRQAELVASVDAASTAHLRAMLHDPAWQALESAWRGLWWLVTNVETGDEISIFMLDVSQEELAADLAAAEGDLARSGLHRSLVERGAGSPGGLAWSVVAGLYTFGGSAEDLSLLAGLSRVCGQAGAPFVAAASPQLLGCPKAPGRCSLAETPEPANWQQDESTAGRWNALRRSPLARNLGLALPGFLLRLPYGPDTDEVDSFPFQELPAAWRHDQLLWANPSLALVQLLAAAFAENGWRMQPGDVRDILDLPAFMYTQDSQKKMQACAEAYLSERIGEAILRHGLMPLLSFQNRNAARLPRFQSIADPPAGLAGPWR